MTSKKLAQKKRKLPLNHSIQRKLEESKKNKLNYTNVGVNQEKADAFVKKIAFMSQATLNRKVKSAVGGYASLYELDATRWLAASTDGVGTKLKLAFELNEHKTVGIDLVAMSVNDILCVGASPLFFLDYFATGKLKPRIAEQVLAGIVQGCQQAGCALVGGETAEMPDFYSEGEYDLAGFAVGLVDAKDALPQKDIALGDRLIGLASTGCHSNGYSLLRKLLEKDRKSKKKPNSYYQKIARDLLIPTQIYTGSVQPLLKKNLLKGLAHITGSGFLNLPRVSEKHSYEVCLPSRKELPSVFEWIASTSQLDLTELAQTFNLGIGMILVVSPSHVSSVMRLLDQVGQKAWEIGQVIPAHKTKGSEVIVHQDGVSATLFYGK